MPGFSSLLGRFLDDGLTLIFVSNLGGFDAAGLAAVIANRTLSLPAPERVPARVPPEQLAAAEGVYTDIIGERLEVVRAGERLTLQGNLKGTLIPLGNATLSSTESLDVTVHFEGLGTNAYARAMAVVPFYWFVVERARGEQAAAR